MTSHTTSMLDQDLHDVSSAISEKRRPQHILDLPVEILNAILKELNHTNDLTSLALCHSTLHSLTVPYIYSRFDIVWPDSASGPEPRSGVDALTYGLSTLVMAEEIFRGNSSQSVENKVKARRGNYYAQFTRKFSLGNGPPEWVQDYLISKEGGKMLGTLVALAIARMRNLESFVWDMPTGILSAVWDALSSLADGDNEPECRLDRVAVRWHNNFLEPRDVPIGFAYQRGGAPPSLSALQHVEHPSFSILPSLKSLSVLDIDEVQYLDEMSVLIKRSFRKLRELRVGIAVHAKHREFVTAWDGEDVNQLDTSCPEMSCMTIGEKRLGGVLGVLTGMIFDLRSVIQKTSRPDRTDGKISVQASTPYASGSAAGVADMLNSSNDDAVPNAAEPHHTTSQPVSTDTGGHSGSETANASHIQDVPKTCLQNSSDADSSSANARLSNALLDRTKIDSDGIFEANLCPKVDDHTLDSPARLTLEILELEQVPLSIPVLQNAIDCEVLTNLTLLRCPNHEHFWKTLRRNYAPKALSMKHGCVPTTCSTKDPLHQHLCPTKEFKLNLKNIHTDTVSTSLISFIRDTLRPNSLESIFFLHAPSYSSNVSLDSIHSSVLRRHRTSLRKVLIDSGERGAESLSEANSYWRQWMFTRDMVKFLVKMPSLREFGAALDYRDWHFFLRNLPYMSQLRSLYIPFLVNFTHGNFVDTKELALQIVDIVAMRPEIELCYVGIMKKCFEILEQRHSQGKQVSDVNSHGTTEDDSASEEDAGVIDETSNDGYDEEDNDDDNSNSEFYASDSQEGDDDDESGRTIAVPVLRLREILYYDDKVSVFKARHGRL